VNFAHWQMHLDSGSIAAANHETLWNWWTTHFRERNEQKLTSNVPISAGVLPLMQSFARNIHPAMRFLSHQKDHH
jgi:hypothetical protein